MNCQAGLLTGQSEAQVAAEVPTDTVARLIEAAREGEIELNPEFVESTLTKAWFTAITNKIMFLLLAVWPIRILVRNYLSNSHLQADASERKAIVETYLGLIHDPDVQSDGQLKKEVLPRALEAIVRHTQTGIVRDDALPQAGIFTLPKNT